MRTGQVDGTYPAKEQWEADFMVQKLLHYDVIDRVGVGAASTIYAVVDPKTRKLYALKHVQRKVDKDIRYIEQMQSEFEVAQQFHHPVLRKCYELKIHKSMLL